MANVWQANYWAGGSRTYNSGHNGYDSSTGYCNVGNLGDMRAGRYGGVDNIVCLRFACNDANYSAVNINCYNSGNYTGQGTVKILVRTSELSTVTRAELENLGTYTREYTCAYNGYSENNVSIEYNFIRGRVYYIYIWGKTGGDWGDTWRFRWNEPVANNYGFSVTYTAMPSYTLYISQGAGTSISVTRNGVALSNGSAINHGETISISIGTHTGYTLTYRSHNNGAYTVSGNITVSATASVISYSLQTTTGANTSISVNRISSPLAGAATGGLGYGSTVYYNDVLQVTFGVSTGYNLTTHTVNGGAFSSGGTFAVTQTPYIVSGATLKTYTLYISQGTGTSVSVKRGSTSLSNGATISHFDNLTISISAHTGYTLTYRSHNNGAYTVSGSITVSATAAINQYTIAISQGAGTTVTVKNGSTTLSNGAKVNHGTQLTVSISVNTGYSLASQSHNNGTYTITGNTTFSATASVLSYTLSISQGSGTTISVNRTSSPKQGASSGALSNGATIYYSDVLTITFGANSGYELLSHTVNGSSFASGGSHTVTGNVTVISSANLSEFLLTTSAGVGSIITVLKNGTPISNGAKITKGDVLTITFGTIDGYKILVHDVNGNEFASGNTITVSGDVLVNSTARIRGVSIGNDSSFDTYVVYIGNGVRYEAYVPYIGNGETWELYGD